MSRGVDVLMKVEGGDELRKKLKRLGRGVLARGFKPHLDGEANALAAAASTGEPRRTGTSMRKKVVQLRAGANEVRYAVAYLSHYAKWVHEGVFGGVQLADRYRHFKWLERATNAFEAGFIERAAGKLWSLVQKEVK